MTTTELPISTLPRAARRLGVPQCWLREEADAGRVPHLRAGRRLLFDIEAVAAVLRERAAESGHTKSGA